MKVFELANGDVREGARLAKYSPAADVNFPAILVGEEGRGRKLSILPVGGQIAESEGRYPDLRYATVGATRRGAPKLFLDGAEREDDKMCLVVFRSPIGFRGSNEHTGDRHDTPCPLRGTVVTPNWQGECPTCGLSMHVNVSGGVDEQHVNHSPKYGELMTFDEFPGTILVRGVIAQGDAGAMGSGEQLVAVIPTGVVFRAGYSGRLYGAPSAHYGRFDGRTLEVLTWKDRQLADKW